MKNIYNEFRLPQKCFVNKDIPKEFFLEYGKMTNTVKTRFLKHFKYAKLVYSLKCSDLGLPEFNYNNTDYNELQIIEVSIKANNIPWLEMLSFSRDIVQSISYPVLLVLKYGQTHYRFVATKIHKGKIDSTKSMVDDIKCTSWIWYEEKRLHKFDKACLNNIMVYLTRSKNIYDLSSNLIALFEKQLQVYDKYRKAVHQSNAYSAYKRKEELMSYENASNGKYEFRTSYEKHKKI